MAKYHNRAQAVAALVRDTEVHKDCYIDEEIFDLEMAHLFANTWVYVGHASQVPKVGDFYTTTVGTQPVVMVRHTDQSVRVLYNRCPHRGVQLVREGHGSTGPMFRCPYHAWTYNLDGSLRGAPAMARNEGFCKEDVKLPSVRVEDWQGWIMVTLTPDAPPVAERLAGVDRLVGHLPMQDYREVFREEFRWDTNWKVLAENFMESYHLPACHAGTIGGSCDLALERAI